MTNLNDIIEQLAKDNCPSLDWDRDKDNWIRGFKEGSALLPKFAEWIRTFEALERQNGQWVIESQLSDEQIVKAFIADNKQKEYEK